MQNENKMPITNENNAMERLFEKLKRRLSKRMLFVAVPIVVVVVVVFGAATLKKNDKEQALQTIPTYKAGKGTLTVTVNAGGTIQALKTFDVKSEMEGQAKILSIVPEGKVITEQDVQDGLVLVQLDSADIVEKEAQQDVTYQNAKAAFTQAEEAYAIQQQQNESNISAAQLNVKFTKMELERYLGADLAAKAIEEKADFANLGKEEALGGEALQIKQSFENAVDLANEKLTRAINTLVFSKKLAEKKYISANELSGDELSEKTCDVEVKNAKLELDLYLRYTLPKESEKRFADYKEAKREQQRVIAQANSQIAQADAERKSKESTLKLQGDRLEKLRKMIKNSTIKATKPGLAIYASTIDPQHYRNNPIEEGYQVRQGEAIISVPDLSTLAVRVDIQETEVQKLKEGLLANIIIEATPGRSWKGRIERISPMAESGNRFLNPNVMIYKTDVVFTEAPADLKPGMSATVEIIVAQVPDVISVPIQAITTHEGKRACWVKSSSGLELREVETGNFTYTHCEIKQGLKEGEIVYLAPPDVPPAEVQFVKLPGGTASMEAKAPKASPEAGSEANGPKSVPAEYAEGQTPQPSRKTEAKAPEGSPEASRETKAASDTENSGAMRQRGEGRRNFDPSQMAERIKNMTPEQRKELKDRMLQRLEGMPAEEQEKSKKQIESLFKESSDSGQEVKQ